MRRMPGAPAGSYPGRHGGREPRGRCTVPAIKADASVASIPVVVLTTSSAVEDVLACYGAHTNAYITKPSGYDDFVGVVRRINQFWLDTVRLPGSVTGLISGTDS